MTLVGNEEGAQYLSDHFGTYTSSLALDANNKNWWENGDYAIWWLPSSNRWFIGLKANMGTKYGHLHNLIMFSSSQFVKTTAKSNLELSHVYQRGQNLIII